VSVRCINPPRMLTSPSFRRISCSTLRWLMMGCEMPPMVDVPVTDETSMETFMLTSLFGCTCGVMSTFTPTSMY